MDVIVVGCGASGIATLRKLYDAGFKVMGLEAAERIGGRIHTIEFGNGVVDIGAAWCHGSKDNVCYELANPLGLIGKPQPADNWYLLSNGERLPNKTGDEIVGELNAEVKKADKNIKKSISQWIREAAKTNKTLTNNPQLTNSIIEWYERNGQMGGQIDPKLGKSLKSLEECWIGEEDFLLNWMGRGYKSILDILLNRYPDPSKEIPVQIHLHKEVETIKWRSSDEGAGNPLVQVKCKDGSLYSAKSVVVTMPVGVLKERHEQLFNPPLPQDKVTTINTLQMCVLDKIYLEFEKPWWPTTPASFSILWREEDKAKFSEDEKWITEIYGFQTVDFQPNVLLAWIYGNGAEAMEKVSLEGVKAGVEKLIDILFKDKFDVAPIKDFHRTKWRTNRWARGAYAHRSVATEEEGGSAVTLSEPLYNGDFPAVCFAGEATSHHRHTAVHGAVESGFREAARLIESFKKL